MGNVIFDVMIELPHDFPHEPPQGYRYEVIRKNSSTIAIWTVCSPGFTYNDGNDVHCIWGFYNHKKRCYYSPVNSTKQGDPVNVKDTTPYSAMIPNINPLMAAFV